jgi:hypothetical protein
LISPVTSRESITVLLAEMENPADGVRVTPVGCHPVFDAFGNVEPDEEDWTFHCEEPE